MAELPAEVPVEVDVDAAGDPEASDVARVPASPASLAQAQPIVATT